MDERRLDDYLDVADQLHLQLQLPGASAHNRVVLVRMHSTLQT